MKLRLWSGLEMEGHCLKSKEGGPSIKGSSRLVVDICSELWRHPFQPIPIKARLRTELKQKKKKKDILISLFGGWFRR